MALSTFRTIHKGEMLRVCIRRPSQQDGKCQPMRADYTESADRFALSIAGGYPAGTRIAVRHGSHEYVYRTSRANGLPSVTELRSRRLSKPAKKRRG